MDRRDFLVMSSVLVGSMSGCVGVTGESDAGPGNDEGGRTGTRDEAEYLLSVRVENPRYLVTTRSSISPELNDAVGVEEFEEPVRGYVREAVTRGSIELEEPDDALLEAVRGLRYVREGDDIYKIDYRLPVYVLKGEEVGKDEIEEDSIVSMMDDVIRTLGVDNEQVVHAANTIVEVGSGYTGEDYRTTSLTPAFREFVSSYDYISYPSRSDPTQPAGYVEIELMEEDPGDYELTAEPVSHEELFGVDRVRDVSALPDDVEEVVVTAVEDEYRGDKLPDGFMDEVGDTFFFMDDEVHRPEVLEPDYDAALVEVKAEVRHPGFGVVDEPVDRDILEDYRAEFEDALEEDGGGDVEGLRDDMWDVFRPEDPGVFELTLTNTSEETVSVMSGAPPPFGVLHASEVGGVSGDRAERLVWSESYVGSDHVQGTPRGLMVNSIGLETNIGPGRQESEEYEVGFAPGSYRVRESLSVSTGQTDDQTYPFTVVISVDENKV